MFSHSLPTACTVFAWVTLACAPLPSFAQRQPIQELETNARESRPADQREQFDDLQSATAYWYESRNPANLPQIDAALKKVLPLALELAPHVRDFTTWERAQFMKPYHYAGAALLAKAYTLLYYGRIEEAKPVVRLIEEKLPFSMFLYSNRTLQWVRENLRYHQHAIAVYMAVAQRKMEGFVFPPERDEFDGGMQARAIQEQAILRLREGDYGSVDHLLSMARKTALRTTSGEWVEDVIYSHFIPIPAEIHSEGAWTELGQAIRKWQRAFPKSEAAHLAEAGFLANHAFYQLWSGQSYSDFRSDIERANEILASTPSNSPGWFTLNTQIKLSAGRPVEEVITGLRDNLEAHPQHYQPMIIFCSVLAHGSPSDSKTCADFLRLASDQMDPEGTARVLNTLNQKGLLDRVQSRLDRPTMDKLLPQVAERWGASYLLRNQLALLAVELGSRDTAATILSGMRDNCSHKLWEGKEDILDDIFIRVPARAEPLKLPKVQ